MKYINLKKGTAPPFSNHFKNMFPSSSLTLSIRLSLIMVKSEANAETLTTINRTMPFQGPGMSFRIPLKYTIEAGIEMNEKTMMNIFNFLMPDFIYTIRNIKHIVIKKAIRAFISVFRLLNPKRNKKKANKAYAMERSNPLSRIIISTKKNYSSLLTIPFSDRKSFCILTTSALVSTSLYASSRS